MRLHIRVNRIEPKGLSGLYSALKAEERKQWLEGLHETFTDNLNALQRNMDAVESVESKSIIEESIHNCVECLRWVERMRKELNHATQVHSQAETPRKASSRKRSSAPVLSQEATGGSASCPTP